MLRKWLEEYKAAHLNPVNRLMHAIGIPMIVISLPLFFFCWKVALVLFVFGWIFQFVGHAVEGNKPLFLDNPMALVVAPIWWIKKLTSKLRCGCSRSRKPEPKE